MTGCQRRNTRQRQTVLQELRASRSHPTASELLRLVRLHMPQISIGTIYRNLEILQEQGQAIRLAGIVGHEARYDGCVTPHSHFQCLNCGALFDLETQIPGLDELVGQELEGHTVDSSQVLLYGLCRDCIKAAGSRDR